MENNLFKIKWSKFLGRVWPFKFIPFIDLVFAAGSLATGNINENSDFDVIVGVRRGRIFTARFLCILFFELIGWRRGKNDKAESASDKICLSHFVTPDSFRLSPPHNNYWKILYSSLVPVYGSPELIQKFWDANQDWIGKRIIYQNNERHLYKKKGLIKKFKEFLLSGKIGDLIEKKLRKIQIERIGKSLKTEIGYKPRLIFTDNELEFHPDTLRTEKY